jgi:hypothetical protein
VIPVRNHVSKGLTTKFGGRAKATPRCPVSGVLLNPRGHRVVVEIEENTSATFLVANDPWVVYIATH